MNISRRFLVFVVACCALSSIALAAGSVVGAWKGHVVMNMTNLPKNLTPQQKQMVDQGMAQIKSMVLTLNFKAGGAYVATATGGPMKKTDTQTGTWKQTGNNVVLTQKKKDGTPGKPETFKLAPNGKTLTLDMPAQGGMTGQVVFVRG